MRYVCVSLFLLSSIYACGGPATTGDFSHRNLEAEALLRSNGGKTDKGGDFCLELGYYGDGLCDPWCLSPDEDCTPEQLSVMGCGITEGPCAVDEMAADTDGNGCIDTCVPDPDYVAPVILELGEECSAQEECGDGRFCAKDAGDCDGVGVCEVRGEMCMGQVVIDIVCACNGAAFANECNARYVGLNIRHAGMCDWLAKTD